MITLNKLTSFILIGMISILSCDKKNTSIEKKVLKITDSLSLDKKYSNKLFIVQHQNKWNKDYIRVSTAEFFNKDSVQCYVSNNGNLIMYYSDFFEKIKGNSDTDKYDNLAYKEGTISVFHPRYVIFELNSNRYFKKNINNDKELSQLFQFGDRYVPEPIK